MKKFCVHILAFLLSVLANSSFGQQAFTKAVLNNPNNHKAFFDGIFIQSETPVYTYQESPNSVLLENGYASFQFQNSAEWPPQGDKVVPTHVKIIFTKYPKNKAFWLTDYQWLLSKRLQALFELDSAFNDISITYSMLLQTDCENAFEAMQLFHGIEVEYKKVSNENTIVKLGTNNSSSSKSDSTFYSDSEVLSRNKTHINKLNRLISNEEINTDSAVYKIMDRNRHWQNSIAVIDWTASVYAYGAEALLWHTIHEDKSGIKYITLFNDGDRKKNRNKTIGYTGGIYTQDAKPMSKVIRELKKVQTKGNGGDSPENDMEALIKSMDHFPDGEQLILIADNYSCIRDFVLLRFVKKPVRVVLVGKTNVINPQYLNLAWRTGGSIHTKDFDLTNITELIRKDALYINGIKYVLTKNNLLMPEQRIDNHFNHCNKFYTYPKRQQKKTRRKDPKCYFTN